MSVWFWTDYDEFTILKISHVLFGGKYTNYWGLKNSSGPSNYRTEAKKLMVVMMVIMIILQMVKV